MPRKKKTDNQSEALTDDKIKELRPWLFKKGDPSPNPAGRPQGRLTLANVIKTIGDEAIDESGLTFLQALIRQMFIESILGDKETRSTLFDRGWGTLVQKNLLMQLGADMSKMAQELGLNADDLRGSTTVQGLLEATGIDLQSIERDEGDQGTQVDTTATTIVQQEPHS